MKHYVKSLFLRICLLMTFIVLYLFPNIASGVEPPNPFLLGDDPRTVRGNEKALKSIPKSEYSQNSTNSFMWGLSQYGSDFDIDEVSEIGIQWYRPHAIWKEIEPEIERKEIAPPDGNWEPLIEEYLATKNWTKTDNNVNQLVSAGIQPFIVIGMGFDSLLPKYQGQVANPNVLGKQNYLDHIYLYARAVVRRYRDRVHYWQIEGELNEAKNTAIFFKWRSGAAWGNWTFLTRLIKVLGRAVKAEDGTAQITSPMHTDVPDWWHERFGGKTWREALGDWGKYMDIIGLDSYPNYLLGEPVRGNIVGLRVAQAAPFAAGKPIIIMESGYPSGPDQTHTEEGQSLFIQEVADTVQRNGGSGFFYFTLYSCDCETTPKVEGYWGLIGGQEHRKKPAWYTYYDIIHQNEGY